MPRKRNKPVDAPQIHWPNKTRVRVNRTQQTGEIVYQRYGATGEKQYYVAFDPPAGAIYAGVGVFRKHDLEAII